MKRHHVRALGFVALLGLLACGESPTHPTLTPVVLYAKGGGHGPGDPTPPTLQFTISEVVGTELVGDGGGPYVAGSCGVGVGYGVNSLTGLHIIVVTLGGRLAKHENCPVGVRTATFRGHPLTSVKLLVENPGDGVQGGAVINMADACGSQGLRFDPRNYAPSDYANMEADPAAYTWHLYTSSPDHDAGNCDLATSEIWDGTVWDVGVAPYTVG